MQGDEPVSPFLAKKLGEGHECSTQAGTLPAGFHRHLTHLYRAAALRPQYHDRRYPSALHGYEMVVIALRLQFLLGELQAQRFAQYPPSQFNGFPLPIASPGNFGHFHAFCGSHSGKVGHCANMDKGRERPGESAVNPYIPPDKYQAMTASPNFLPYIRNKSPLALSRQFTDQPVDFLTMYKAKYGDTFRARVFLRDITVTADPSWMRYILQTHHKDFGRGYAYQVLKLALGNGLLVNEGESWMQQRRLAQPAFYKQRLSALFHVMEETANNMVSGLERQRGETVSVTDLFWKVTSDLVIATLLGGKGPVENAGLQHMILEMQQYLVDRIRFPFGIPWMMVNGRHRRFKKLMARFDEGIYRIIRERRVAGSGGDDLLGMLMEARDEDSGEQMSDKQLRDEFLTIYVAGHETSSYALSWTMYLLAKNPEAMERVKWEARALPDPEAIGYEGLVNLNYIRQVLFESMRLYPPAWIAGRKVLADHTIDNTPVKKGDAILLNIYGLHHDSKFWPEPLAFRPERFSPEAERQRDKFTYLPFGAGPRMCIGNNFAIMEITMLLAKLFSRFDFEMLNQTEVKPDPLITLRPGEDILMRIN